MVFGGRDSSTRGLTRALVLAVLVGVATVVGLIIAYEALFVLQVAAVGALLALVLRTVARGLEVIGLSPFVAAIVLLAGFGAFGAFVYFVMIPNIAEEVRILLSQGQGSLSDLSDTLDALPGGPDSSEVAQRLESYLSNLLDSVPNLVMFAVEEIVAIISVVFLALYLAVDPDTYVRGLLRLVPVDRRETVSEFVDDLVGRLRGWVVGTALVASFVGVTGGVGLWLLGVPLALTFGILAGVLDIIPYVGSIVGGALPALIALTISPTKALEVAALFFVINQIEGNLLQPKIMGSRVNVPAAMILVSILLFATLVGPVVGTLLAVPAAVTVVTLLDWLTEQSNEQSNTSAKEDESDNNEQDG